VAGSVAEVFERAPVVLAMLANGAPRFPRPVRPVRSAVDRPTVTRHRAAGPAASRAQ
jgi:hypothetical protein